MKDLYLVGAGGCGREVLSMILDMHEVFGQKWNIKGFLDDIEEVGALGKECDYPVVGSIRNYVPAQNDVLLMCIASPRTKRYLIPELISRGAVFDSFVSPWAKTGRHNKIGLGAIVYSGFSMSVNVSVGDYATLLSCALGHDVVVGDYCTISGNCGLMGGVKVEDGVFMGDSVRVAPNVIVGRDAYVGIGSVVVKNVKPGEKVFGNPAREIGI